MVTFKRHNVDNEMIPRFDTVSNLYFNSAEEQEEPDEAHLRPYKIKRSMHTNPWNPNNKYYSTLILSPFYLLQKNIQTLHAIAK